MKKKYIICIILLTVVLVFAVLISLLFRKPNVQPDTHSAMISQLANELNDSQSGESISRDGTDYSLVDQVEENRQLLIS